MCCDEFVRFNLQQDKKDIRLLRSVDDMIPNNDCFNQLYSNLSLLARQSMLMLKELPEMVTVFERFF